MIFVCPNCGNKIDSGMPTVDVDSMAAELKAARKIIELLRHDVELQVQMVRAEQDFDFDRSRELFLELQKVRKERKRLEAEHEG